MVGLAFKLEADPVADADVKRDRSLELALFGGGSGGMSLEGGTYLDAPTQGAHDVAESLDRLAERLGA